MKQKPITGDPIIGKKHVVFLAILNIGAVLFFDKHVYAHCRLWETQDTDAKKESVNP